jgi:putative colanic acid biosynthesis acetyltransferase WcaF
MGVRLDRFDNAGFDRGRPAWVEAAWLVVQALFVSSFIPGSTHRRMLLALFGADIASGVIVKPRVRVKFPWKLKVGGHTWIGEGVWIDNLAPVSIGAHVCLSQGAYLCAGSHDWSLNTFDLVTKPIVIEGSAWIAARCVVAPGVTVGEGAILALGSVATRSLEAWTIYAGSPAQPVKRRPMPPPSEKVIG